MSYSHENEDDQAPTTYGATGLETSFGSQVNPDEVIEWCEGFIATLGDTLKVVNSPLLAKWDETMGASLGRVLRSGCADCRIISSALQEWEASKKEPDSTEGRQKQDRALEYLWDSLRSQKSLEHPILKDYGEVVGLYRDSLKGTASLTVERLNLYKAAARLNANHVKTLRNLHESQSAAAAAVGSAAATYAVYGLARYMGKTE